MIHGKYKHNSVPHNALFTILELLQDKGYDVYLTDTARTIKEHIDLYKRIYGAEWLDHIAWGSRHLPNWIYEGMLMAVDLKAKKIGSSNFLAGCELAELLRECAKEIGVNIGLGIGALFCHVDIREHHTEWRYDY